MKPVGIERPERKRYPRLREKEDLKIVRFISELRKEYPAPEYDPRYDGSWNPADVILSSYWEKRTKKVQELCRKHSLKDTGWKGKLIKRLYLHWRSKKMMLGQVFYGYSKGCELVGTPTCVCGTLRRDEMEQFRKEREERKAMIKRAENGPRRYPRLYTRYPRLGKKK